MQLWPNTIPYDDDSIEFKPYLTPYLAEGAKLGVVICPGGGYAIRAEHEGKGYATAAVRLAVELARAVGKYEGIYLDCAPDNVSARHIYDKLGFVPTGEINHGSTEMKIGF